MPGSTIVAPDGSIGPRGDAHSSARSRHPTTLPDRALERTWQARGARRIAGIDEVGRGPLAGPVVAAAVILPPGDDHAWLPALRDSKALTARQREALDRRIRGEAPAVAVGVAAATVIDEIGIAAAARLAMRRAVRGFEQPPDVLLIDAFLLPEAGIAQQAVIRGDGSCSAIAAASIVAKVARDRMMDALDRRFPGYGFARNRGYGTAEHLAALACLGPSSIHRRSFAPVRDCGGG